MPQWYMYNVVKRQIGEDVLVMFRSGAGVSRRVVIHCRALLVHDDGGGGGRMSSRSQQKALHTPDYSNLLVNIPFVIARR